MSSTDQFDESDEYTWDVPGDVAKVTAYIWGAGGGDGTEPNHMTGEYGDGGPGGYVEGEIDVTDADTLDLFVGEHGEAGVDYYGWGYHNGGDGGADDVYGGSGGGSSAVVIGGSLLLEAGGGGGGGGGGFDDGFSINGDGGGGGGGGSGGEGGSGPDDGEDGEGSLPSGGDGGDGGGRYGTDAEDGDPGSGYTSGSSLVLTASTSTGSGNPRETDGEIHIEYSAAQPPENLTAEVIDDDTIKLEWDDGGDSVTFNVYRDTDSGVSPSGSNYIDTTSSLSYTDSGLDSGVRYYYVVTAVTSADETASSNEADALTPSEPDTPANFTATAVDKQQIDLEWDQGGDTEPDAYIVYRAESSGTDLTDYTEIASTPGTEYTDDGLVNGRAYYYRVTAENDLGESDPTDEEQATTDLPEPTLDLDSSADREVSLGWAFNDDNPDGDLVLTEDVVEDVVIDSVDSDGDDEKSGSSLHDDLLDGKMYTYTATRDTLDASVSVTETATTILPSVDNLDVVSVESRFVTLSWVDPSNNTDYYQLLLRQDDEGSYSQDGDDISGVDEGESVEVETTELLDGQLYGAVVETIAEDAEVRSDE